MCQDYLTYCWVGSKKLASHLIYFFFFLTYSLRLRILLSLLLSFAFWLTIPPPLVPSSTLADLTSVLLSYFSWIENYWWLYIRRMTDVLHKGPYVGEVWRCAKKPIIFYSTVICLWNFQKTFPRDKTSEPAFLFYIDFWPNIAPVNRMCKYEAGWQDSLS